MAKGNEVLQPQQDASSYAHEPFPTSIETASLLLQQSATPQRLRRLLNAGDGARDRVPPRPAPPKQLGARDLIVSLPVTSDLDTENARSSPRLSRFTDSCYGC